MSAELIGILSVCVALGGLVLASQARTDKRLDALQAELRRLEGLIEGAGLFRPADALAPASTGD